MNQVRCPACQSEKLIPRREISDTGTEGYSSAEIVFYTNPNARIFKEPYSTPIYVNVCGECGHCSLFIENPSEVWEAYLRSQQSK